ncbi:hypothetical protein BRC86_03820 [Halobacteriales archaeon QS_3_64_16]|nr:MAG: hypothetical protein BRC86_03820 [Halobacteriales archaeon QS_3_64_16]
MGSPERVAPIEADAMESPAEALFLADSERSFEAVASLLETEHGIGVRVASDDEAALDRVGSVDCIVRAYRPADREPATVSGLDAADIAPSIPTVIVCADGIEAARALSAGADRCVQDEGESVALAAHLAAAIRRERDDRERERARYEEREFLTSALDTLPDVFYAVDPDGRLTHWNDRLNQVTSYSDAELAGMTPEDLVAEEDTESRSAATRCAARAGSIKREVTLHTKAGEAIPYEVTSAPYSVGKAGDSANDDGDGVAGWCGIGRDITERRERERDLRAEQSFSESVLDAIPDVFYAIDDRGEFLRWNDRLNEATGYTDAELAGMDPLSLVASEDRESVAEAMTTVFAGGEAQTRNSRLRRKDDEEIPYEFNGSTLTDADGEIVGLAGTARDVTERRHRERALRYQADRLERLDRINAVIRDVDRALVRASTREEVEREVCERLASATPYRFAWIGESEGGAVTPRTWAGVEDGYLDAQEAGGGDAESPEKGTAIDRSEASDVRTARTAIRTGDIQVVQQIAEESGCEPWREAALDRGYRSVAAVPLIYRGTTYGVLCIYASDPNAFEDTERTVIDELAGTIAYAISAAERRRALMTDTVIEVTLAICDPSRFLLGLSADLDCHLALEGLVPQPNGSLVEFVSIEGVPASAVLERASEAGVEATVVSDAPSGNVNDTESVVRFLVPGHDSSISAALADHGGVLTEATAEGGEARIVAEFPTDTDVRAVLAALESNYPDTELLARQERERTDASGTRLRGALADALTDRQHEILETAYHAGYFEWPRERSGEELADSFDVAKPTLHEHLRAAERKLLGTFFDQRLPEQNAP